MGIWETHSCIKCGSVDVSLDVETNQITCLKCGKVGKPGYSSINDISINKHKGIYKDKKPNSDNLLWIDPQFKS